jgi:hypothetical protein
LWFLLFVKYDSLVIQHQIYFGMAAPASAKGQTWGSKILELAARNGSQKANRLGKPKLLRKATPPPNLNMWPA